MINALRPDATPIELLALRLGSHGPLRADDLAPFAELQPDIQSFAAAGELSRTGEGVSGLRLVCAGFVAEVRTMSDGRRQITALRLPGDLFGSDWSPQNCDVVALTPARCLDARALVAARQSPSPRFDRLRQAWAAAQQEEESRMADHIVRLGRLSAMERVGHLLLELHERLLRVGLAAGSGFHLPLTQEMLADVLGLSIVHVNRTLQQLRRDGLIMYRQGHVSFPDLERLAAASYYTHRVSVVRRQT